MPFRRLTGRNNNTSPPHCLLSPSTSCGGNYLITSGTYPTRGGRLPTRSIAFGKEGVEEVMAAVDEVVKAGGTEHKIALQ